MKSAGMRALLLLALVLGPGLMGCGDRQKAKPVFSKAVKTNIGHGRVLSIDSTGVTIRHDEIPGYMAAMTMHYPVADTAVLSGISPGDSVSFQIRVKGYQVELMAIEKVEPAGYEDGQ